MTHAAFKVQRTNSSSRCRRLWLATVWFLTAYRGWCACRVPEGSLLGCLLALITFKGMVKAANTTKWKLRECYLLKTLHLKYLLENEELFSAFLFSCIKHSAKSNPYFFSLVLQQASTEYQFMKLLSSLVFLGDRERVRKRSENCRGWGFILQGNESEVCL